MSVKGYIDLVAEDHVHGWAFDPGTRGAPATVELLANGKPIATGQANIFRADLKAAGIGNGEHAFRIDIPSHARNREYEVRVRGARESLPRSSSPVSEPKPDPVRVELSSKYLQGDGIEIGALHFPLPVPKKARVKYVDRMTREDLRTHYPELRSLPLVHVDYVADGEKLEVIPDASQNFVIANHFLEHTQNPLSCLSNLMRVLKTGGILYLALPDKRHTFDIDRPVTPFEHILKDYREGPASSRLSHFEEWVSLVDKMTGEAGEQRLKFLLGIDYSIHFHVWVKEGMEEMLQRAQQVLNLSWRVEESRVNGHEVIFVLRKS